MYAVILDKFGLKFAEKPIFFSPVMTIIGVSPASYTLQTDRQLLHVNVNAQQLPKFYLPV